MVIKLGLAGNLQDVPQESLTFSAIRKQDINRKARSVDNTLHIDYKPPKKIFRLNYRVMSETNFDFLEAIQELQASSLQPLQFQIDDQLGALETFSVYMPPMSHGAIIRNDGARFYYTVNINLEER